MGSRNSSSSMEAVVNAWSIVSIAGMTEETSSDDVKKNSVPSFKI